MNSSYLDVNVDEGGVPDPVVVDVDDGVEVVVEKTSSVLWKGKQTNERIFKRVRIQQLAFTGGRLVQLACLGLASP